MRRAAPTMMGIRRKPPDEEARTAPLRKEAYSSLLSPENDNAKHDTVDEAMLPRAGAEARSHRVELLHGNLLRNSVRALTRHRTMVAVAGLVLVIALAASGFASSSGPSTKAAATDARPGLLGRFGLSALARAGMAQHRAVNLPPATAPPEPAPPSVADAPPLKPHEVFGFAPYWTLPQSDGFNVAGISTLAYFSLDVNPDGSIAQSGSGWNGYQSQALVDLVDRAHAAGDRVVLTVENFDQSQLNQLTSSPAAASFLATQLLWLVVEKKLDGVNLDFEGQGSADQAGLTRLVTTVSDFLHASNPHYQVTMDTYSSSAAGSNGFFNVPALASVVDAFFVMEYNPNVAAAQSTSSPLTSGMFSDQTAVDEYASSVPSSKVILGLPFFGIDWPTSDGTLTAQATGPATTPSLGDILASGHPLYWDPVTESGWTSYQVGGQWHETFFDVPTSFYAAAELAQNAGLGGVGIWALGMDGNDPADLAALLGFAPAVKGGPVGPASPGTPAATPSTSTSTTSPSATTGPTDSGTTTSTTSGTTTSTDSAAKTTTSVPASSTTTTTTTNRTTTTTTTAPTTATTTTTTAPTFTYGGEWNGAPVVLTEVSGSGIPEVSGASPAGQLTGFTTNDPSTACLSTEPSLNVWAVQGSTTDFLVVTTTPGDCASSDFVFTTG
jgi:hypothetical protein